MRKGVTKPTVVTRGVGWKTVTLPFAGSVHEDTIGPGLSSTVPRRLDVDEVVLVLVLVLYLETRTNYGVLHKFDCNSTPATSESLPLLGSSVTVTHRRRKTHSYSGIGRTCGRGTTGRSRWTGVHVEWTATERYFRLLFPSGVKSGANRREIVSATIGKGGRSLRGHPWRYWNGERPGENRKEIGGAVRRN